VLRFCSGAALVLIEDESEDERVGGAGYGRRGLRCSSGGQH
jgi:hypothetical protein